MTSFLDTSVVSSVGFTSSTPVPLILYATETGTAEDVAFKLHDMLKTRSYIANIQRIDDYNITNLPNEICIFFIVSTAGDGTVTSNMKQFWNFLLRKNLPTNSLALLNYAIFGLGDSSYDKYNAAARMLNSRLKQLGSREIVPIGLGDDQAQYGYLTALDPWLDTLCSALKINSESVNDIPSIARYPPQYNIRYSNDKRRDGDGSYSTVDSLYFTAPANVRVPILHHTSNTDSATINIPPIEAKVIENSRITDANWNQDVRHIVMRVDKNQETVYQPGDVAVVYPENAKTFVTRAISLLNKYEINDDPCNSSSITDTTTVIIEKINSNISSSRRSRLNISAASATTTIYDLFKKCLDITGIPLRSFFQQLSVYASNSEEKEKLYEISTASGNDIYYNYCIKEKRNYIEVLEDFKSVKVPLYNLIDMIPLLLPRSYSIASSYMTHPCEIHLCVAVVSYKTKYGRNINGVCTNYLASLSPVSEDVSSSSKVLLYVIAGAFMLPKYSPLVLVGPGTGVAPMRSIMHERIHLQKRDDKVDKVLLFFGCRKKKRDYLYGSEWDSINTGATSISTFSTEIIDSSNNSNGNNNNCNKVVTAFSQDQESKVYVSNMMDSHSELIWKYLNDHNGTIFIAGNTKMPKNVKAALINIVINHGNMSKENAERYIIKLEQSKRYIVEAW